MCVISLLKKKKSSTILFVLIIIFSKQEQCFGILSKSNKKHFSVEMILQNIGRNKVTRDIWV